jgi:hypothetical protein
MESIIEQVYSKFVLCVLLTQMGKTFTTIQRIITELEQDAELGRSIHVVFTMNTMLSNKQFARRLKMIEDTYGKGSICIFMSKYSGPYCHVKTRLELQGRCFTADTCPRVIVVCSNERRYDDGFEFLKAIDTNRTIIDRAFAYYDELHKYITDTLRLQIEQIHGYEKVKGIVALTATPMSIFRKSGFWSKIRLINLDNFNEADYVSCKEMKYCLIDDFFDSAYVRPRPFDYDTLDKHTIGFIKHVLKKHPAILGENTRSFIPAHIRRVGHDAVRDLVFCLNPTAVVVVLNGVEKTLQFKDADEELTTLLVGSDEEEASETIAALILQNELQNRPLVITGYICVGMGQTLAHKALGPFTSAIFGHLDLTNDEIYQLVGRITGRMKNWPNYVRTKVYCPTAIMHRCKVMEDCARNIATEHNGEVVDRDTYIKPMHTMGEAGAATLANMRPEKKEKVPKEGGVVSEEHKMFCSRPTVVIPLNAEQDACAADSYRRKLELWALIREIRPDVYAEYEPSKYKPHAWKVDNLAKYKKWSIERLLTDSTFNTIANLETDKGEHLKDVVMIYYCDGTLTGGRKCLILKPWNGTAWPSSSAGAGAGASTSISAVFDDGRAAGGAGAS